ncbi:MAG: ABC transporter permease [Gemmatimonadota bacterium]|jgi:predicted permease
MDVLLTDLKYGIRMLVKTPALTAVSVLTIALGVGLTTHTFSSVYGSVIRGLDFDRGTKLASLSREIPETGERGGSIPYLDVLDWREQQTSFRGLAAVTTGTVNMADEGNPPERYNGAFVSANLFEQVDGVPLLGRVFNPSEDAGLDEPVVILGYDVWQERYAGDPGIVGRRMRVNGRQTTVVGVMPEGFHFPFQEDVWLPLGIDPLQAERGMNQVAVVGRLLEGVTLDQANVQMDQIAARTAAEYPETNEGVSVWVQSYEDSVMPPAIVAALWTMLLAVFGVLLIACFNVANLLLARSSVRSREMAVRSALGAGRRRIIRQLLVESGLVAVLGGAAGIALAYVGIEAFNAVIIDIEKPYWIDVRLDPPTLLFTLFITAFAAIAAGTLPALRASGANLNEVLRDESRGTSSLRLGRFSAALVIGEIALSCALLVAAGMMIKSVVNLRTLDMGFEPSPIFTARLGLFDTDYPDDDSRWLFYDRLVQDLAAEPGVTAAALTTSLPAVGAGATRIGVEGADYPDVRDQPIAYTAVVSPDYFDVLGVDLTEGRPFDERDVAGSVEVALVNESLARAQFGSDSPLGKRFRVGRDGPWLSVVGVVPDIFIGSGGPGFGQASEITAQYFLPLAQVEGVRFVSLAVSTQGSPGAFASAARDVVSGIDPALPIYFARTMEETVAAGTWGYRVFGSLFTIFGIVALFLAAVGLYGVMAFSVSSRTQELGVRMAMGAEGRDILTLVLGKGMKQLALGALIGSALGALLVQPMRLLFFDVQPGDPVVYVTIVLTLGLAGLLACLLPARRATRVQLVDALRPE